VALVSNGVGECVGDDEDDDDEGKSDVDTQHTPVEKQHGYQQHNVPSDGRYNSNSRIPRLIKVVERLISKENEAVIQTLIPLTSVPKEIRKVCNGHPSNA
jgi:hypothetical protein